MAHDIARFRAIGNPVATTVAELLDFFMAYHKAEKWGFHGAPLHDPCTIAWLLKPEMFTTVERWVGVETGEIHSGYDGGGLLFTDGQSTQYHADGGYRPGSVRGFAGGKTQLLQSGPVSDGHRAW